MAVGMDCAQAREQLSARLDGEHDPAASAAVDAHAAGCASCTAWAERADQVTRLTRTAAALPAPALGPDALATILAAAPVAPPATGSTRRSPLAERALRLALLAVGLAQFLLGVAQISSLAAADAHHAGFGSVSSGHLWHESAAWNVAIGAALAWLAWRRTRPNGLLPVMTAFVVVLGLLTANDAVFGRVEAARILSHSLVLAGYALLLLLNLPRFGGRRPPGSLRRPGSSWRLGDTGPDDEGPLAPVLPLPVRVHSGTPATAEHKRAA
ncbi:zf-HC2 domain-containing protein [Catellatospora sp. KI3]|uniref:zf-HC2 domain-containing protein n=1 Tax=Catellatospora sp. KI3 TaxID=3041620 RepID=UPI00248217DF|nr:zf-HC2 domain-containing protein [Catellatospora sp. KI3]MDI1464061.1 zf-HC2 domain-containing protein [Catellatospora sp. KI3]